MGRGGHPQSWFQQLQVVSRWISVWHQVAGGQSRAVSLYFSAQCVWMSCRPSASSCQRARPQWVLQPFLESHSSPGLWLYVLLMCQCYWLSLYFQVCVSWSQCVCCLLWVAAATYCWTATGCCSCNGIRQRRSHRRYPAAASSWLTATDSRRPITVSPQTPFLSSAPQDSYVSSICIGFKNK